MSTSSFEEISRAKVPELDEIIGKPFKVLDDGFVRLIDYMGSDSAIVQAARISYGTGTKRVSEDRGLIRYLLRNQHTTPFEMCEIKIHVRVPMDCWRQWIRHRTANVNEYSTRYSIAIDSAQKTDVSKWRRQSVVNKQGSSDFLDEEIGTSLSLKESAIHNEIWKTYNDRINFGVSKEQARKDLPLSTYTEAYWKIDLHNLLHFLKLRMDSHAQVEIRNYANVIGNEIVKRWCPAAWDAFVDYQLESMRLSKIEMEIIKKIVSSDPNLIKFLIHIGFLKLDGQKNQSREREELEKKLHILNIQVPWE